jgi:hypothetical protein
MESGHGKARERRRVWQRRPERGMHGSAPQDSESTPRPSGSSRAGGSVAGRQAEEAPPGTRPACEDSNPIWECTSSSLGKNALET